MRLDAVAWPLRSSASDSQRVWCKKKKGAARTRLGVVRTLAKGMSPLVPWLWLSTLDLCEVFPGKKNERGEERRRGRETERERGVHTGVVGLFPFLTQQFLHTFQSSESW